MIFYGNHGVSEAEKQVRRRFEVDCELTLDIARAAAADSLADTVDYGRVYQMIENIFRNDTYNLVETLAAKIADTLFESFQLEKMTVRVRKINPPVGGPLDYMEVETERSRQDV
jgi:dihydroneopterin aldolase